MQQATRLFANGLLYNRVGMTQGADGDAAQAIQVLFALFIPEIGALAVAELYRQAGIGMHDVVGHFPGPKKRKGSLSQTAAVRSRDNNAVLPGGANCQLV